MTTRQIAGLDFRAHSPSLLEYLTPSSSVWLGYDGRRWRVAIGSEPWGTRPFLSAVEAALLIAGAFQQARQEC